MHQVVLEAAFKLPSLIFFFLIYWHKKEYEVILKWYILKLHASLKVYVAIQIAHIEKEFLL